MIVWLILYFAQPNASYAMHVGNFKTIEACQAAANSSATFERGLSGAPQNFVCVQASETGTVPPP
jgi:hypothetical protein